MSDEYFIQLIKKAMSELSQDHIEALEDVSILVADEPNKQQKQAIHLRDDSLLLGLFEGVPVTERTGYESGVVSNTITLFKHPLQQVAKNEQDLYEQIKRTIWHEIAHYYGISHEQMHELQQK